MRVRGNYHGEAIGIVFVPLVNLAVRERDYGATVHTLEISTSHTVCKYGANSIYEGYLATLPTAKSSRKKRLAYVSIRSDVPEAELLDGRAGEAWVLPYPAIEFVAAHVDALTDELCVGLECLRAAVRRRDDFRVADLIRDVRAFFGSRPRAAAGLRELALRAIEVDGEDARLAHEAEEAALRSEVPTLTEAGFWSIIEKMRPDPERGFERAVAALSRMEERDIQAFEELLSRMLFELDTKAHACRGKSGPYEGSGDGFLYLRCSAVAKGRDFYEEVLANPSHMPEVPFEDLLSLSAAAYKKRTGDRFEPRTSVSYETGSNLRGWP